jgi:hypothetical protein
LEVVRQSREKSRKLDDEWRFHGAAARIIDTELRFRGIAAMWEADQETQGEAGWTVRGFAAEPRRSKDEFRGEPRGVESSRGGAARTGECSVASRC